MTAHVIFIKVHYPLLLLYPYKFNIIEHTLLNMTRKKTGMKFHNFFLLSKYGHAMRCIHFNCISFIWIFNAPAYNYCLTPNILNEHRTIFWYNNEPWSNMIRNCIRLIWMFITNMFNMQFNECIETSFGSRSFFFFFCCLNWLGTTKILNIL